MNQKMFRLFTFFFICFLLVFINGCELISVNIDSGATPFSQRDLNIRFLTREFAAEYFKETEKGADAIISESKSKNQYNQAVLWKIYAIEGMQLSVFRVSPEAALLDSWIFSNQVNQYFTGGLGQKVFGKEQYIAINTSLFLSNKIESLAKGLLPKNDFNKMNTFVKKFAKEHPFTEYLFTRTPAFQKWLKYQGIEESEAVSISGTMPEALSDLSDRLSNISTVSPKILTWKAELIANNSALNADSFNATLEGINQASEKFKDYVINNPEYMRMLAVEMGEVLNPIIKNVDKQTDEKLLLLSDERKALEIFIERERIAIGLMVAAERQNITKGLDSIAQNALEKAINELTQLISNVLIYLIIFIIVIFFSPFALGYYIGKRNPKKRA